MLRTRSREDMENFLSLARFHGIPIPEEAIREYEALGPFTGVISERNANLSPDISISAQLQPRYVAGGLHRHEYFELVCVCRGSLRQTICNKTMELKTGDFCIIAPDVWHDLSIFSDAVVIYVSIRRSSFDQTIFRLFSPDDVLQHFFTGALYGKSDYPYVLFHAGEDDDLLRRVLELYRESNAPGLYTDRVRFSYLSLILLGLLRDHTKDLETGSAEMQSLATIVPILQYMQTHYATARRDTVAAVFHYHEAYLSRLIHRATGQTFARILQEIRLRQAQRLLTTTDLPISEIVSAVGLSSVSHFHKIYLEHFGCRPGEARVRLQKQQ